LEEFLQATYHTHHFDALKCAHAIHGDYPVYTVAPTQTTANLKPTDRGRLFYTGNMTQVLSILCADGHLQPGTYVLDTTRPATLAEQYQRLLCTHRDLTHPACLTFKNQHINDKHFRFLCQTIERTFCEWLRNASEPL
jgi:hypothetical protein